MRFLPSGAAVAKRPPVADFESLARAMRSPLMRYFSRRTGSAVDAEELVQDLFVRLLRRPGLMALENLEGYIFEAAANLVRDKVKRDRSRAAHETAGAEHVEAPAEQPAADQVIGGRQNLHRIKLALGTLSPRARTIVMLRRFEGMSHAEIAARLHISVSAVEKHLARAMVVLRDALHEAEA